MFRVNQGGQKVVARDLSDYTSYLLIYLLKFILIDIGETRKKHFLTLFWWIYIKKWFFSNLIFLGNLTCVPKILIFGCIMALKQRKSSFPKKQDWKKKFFFLCLFIKTGLKKVFFGFRLLLWIYNFFIFFPLVISFLFTWSFIKIKKKIESRLFFGRFLHGAPLKSY